MKKEIFEKLIKEASTLERIECWFICKSKTYKFLKLLQSREFFTEDDYKYFGKVIYETEIQKDMIIESLVNDFMNLFKKK